MIIRGCHLPLATYRRRRRSALRLLRKASGSAMPLLLIGVPEDDVAAMLQTQTGKRRQDPWFDWFCGCHEPDAALLIDPNQSAKDTLFLDPGRPERVVWDGPRLAPGPAAKRVFGVHAVRPLAELRLAVERAVEAAGGKLAMFSRKREPGFQAQQFEVWRRRLRGVKLHNAEPDLIHLRMIKDADEIAWHRQAVATTAKGLAAVYRGLSRMKTEAEVAGVLAQHYLGATHEPLAFATIVGSAVNAATLHYPHNDQPLVKRACVLIDSGARAGGYCADVTRTVPQHGRFTDKRFREIYELVLKAQSLGIKHARPGITLKEWNDIAWQPILEAGFQRHHGLGHHLGLDVHDPCDLEAELAPGMLVTCEPGIYLPDEGIGVRIEDNLLITANGCENTTRKIPKTVAGIEKAMR